MVEEFFYLQPKAIMLHIFILSLALLCVSSHGYYVQYETGTYSSSCTQICSAADLLCADSMLQSMDCANVAANYCGSNSIVSNSNIGCTVSGCYVNCKEYYYYSKSSAFSSCNSAGTCLTTSSSLYKHCPCYEAGESELEGWATVGLYLAGAIVVGGAIYLIAIAVKKFRYSKTTVSMLIAIYAPDACFLFLSSLNLLHLALLAHYMTHNLTCL